MPMPMYSFRQINPKNPIDMDAFVNSSLSFYGNKPRTVNSLSRTKKLVKAGRHFQFYLVTSEDRILGRMAVGRNGDLVDEANVPYGQVGLFEVVEDYDVFKAMMDFAKTKLAKTRRILFPFYLSTWHQYRFISNGFDAFRFFLETENREYYSDFARQYGVESVVHYKSVMELDLDGLMERMEKSYTSVKKAGVTFRTLDRKNLMQELRWIYDLSIRGFSANRFYTEITYEQFLDLSYESVKMVDPEFFMFACDTDGKPVGYIFSSPDYTDLLENTDITTLWGKIKFLLFRSGVDGYIVKSVTVLPEYRNKNIFGALLYVNGMKARKRNYSYMIGALAYADNVSISVLTPNRVEKEYELYQLSAGE